MTVRVSRIQSFIERCEITRTDPFSRAFSSSRRFISASGEPVPGPLDGRTIGHADPKSGLEEYCDRWEWGVRALVTGAAEISKGLGLGASHYEREEKWAGDQLKNFTMDLIGDPSLTPDEIKGMSWGDLWEHNKNAITDPQWALTPEEMRKHQELGQQLRQTMVEDLETIGRHSVDPSSLVTDTIDGFERDGFTAPSPSTAESRPADKPETK